MCILDLRVMRKTPGKIVTKEDMEKIVEIILTETETLRLFNLPTVMISVEAEEAAKVMYVWFHHLHYFCNLNAKTEFLVLFFCPWELVDKYSSVCAWQNDICYICAL